MVHDEAYVCMYGVISLNNIVTHIFTVFFVCNQHTNSSSNATHVTYNNICSEINAVFSI